MIELAAIALSGIINRFRGDNTIAKWLWFLIMMWIAAMLGHTWYFLICLATILAGYAVLPWQAMFSAINGMPPSRPDNQMQDVALYLTKLLPTMPIACMWRTFGVIYGAIRSLPAIVGVLMLYGYTGNPNALYGLLFVFMGAIYYLSGKICYRFNWHKHAVAGAEIVMGALLGLFLVMQ